MRDKSVPIPSQSQGEAPRRGQFLSVFEYTGRAFRLAFDTSRSVTLWLGGLSLAGGLLPGAIAYVGKLIVDAVVMASQGAASGMGLVLSLVLLELGFVVLLSGAQRGLGVCESLLRALLGQRVNEMILEKALTLSPSLIFKRVGSVPAALEAPR